MHRSKSSKQTINLGQSRRINASFFCYCKWQDMPFSHIFEYKYSRISLWRNVKNSRREEIIDWIRKMRFPVFREQNTIDYPNQCIHSLYRTSSTDRLKHSAEFSWSFPCALHIIDYTSLIPHTLRYRMLLEINLRKKKYIVTFCCLLNVLHASRFSNKRTKRKQFAN